MFSRQWFPPGSQIGLTSEALAFEELLSLRKYSEAYDFLFTYVNLSLPFWSRQFKRLRHLSRCENSNEFSLPNRRISVFFSDFWPDMAPFNCQLFDFLCASLPSRQFVVVNNPVECDIALFSCYGNLSFLSKTSHATRIIYLSENVRPRYDYFDYSISFDRSSYCGRNICLPLWMFELDWFNKSYPDRVTYPLSSFTNARIFNYSHRKPSIVYIGNNSEPFRRAILYELVSRGIPVDEYGSHTNPIVDKISILSEYRATLCFENSFYPGYTTEKPLHAFLAGTYGLYWGCTVEDAFSNHPLIVPVKSNLHPEKIVDLVIDSLNICGNVTIPGLFDGLFLSNLFSATIHDIKKILSPFDI